MKVIHHDEVTDQSDDIQSNSTITPTVVRATIDEAYDTIEKQMLDSIPLPKIAKHRKTKMYESLECTRPLQTAKRPNKENKNCKDERKAYKEKFYFYKYKTVGYSFEREFLVL